MLNVYELLSAVGIDVFNRLLANTQTGEAFVQAVREQVAQYDKLRVYCNGLFAVISNTYAMTVPQITDSWIRISEKFNTKTLKNIDQVTPMSGPAMPGPAAPALPLSV
jgi:hypothetical protein